MYTSAKVFTVQIGILVKYSTFTMQKMFRFSAISVLDLLHLTKHQSFYDSDKRTC